MKEVVRKKLELAPSTRLSLAQLVEDQRIDLEDEADFSAFKFGTSIKSEMYVEVSLSTPPVAQLASPSITSPSLNLDHSSTDPIASSSRQPPAQSTAASAKPKRTKKAPAASADTNELDKPNGATSQAKPISKQAPPPSEAPVASAVQPKPKKRSRKGDTEEEPATTSAGTADNSAIDEPPDPAPPKKKRKSKTELAEPYGPVAVSLPPPGPARRKSVTAATAEKPALVAPVTVGSNADIILRWASDSGASTSKLAAPVVPTTETTSNHIEGTEKPKKKKKAKEAPVQSLAETVPSEPPICLVCLKAHPGSSLPLSCPLLTRRDSDIISMVEKRVKDLMASQGPDRANQMAISRLKDWLKQRAQEAEAQNAFAPPNSSTPVSKANPTKPKTSSSPNIQLGATGASRPVVPKKSKLSSVAVSHQSERSSTDDEDIVKSVMQSAPESDAETTEEDDGSDDEETANPSNDPTPAEPVRKAAPPPPPKVSAPAKSVVAPTPRVSSSNPSNLVLSRQRMSRSDIFALLDGLEDEETGEAKQDESDGDEDDGGNELAESTPSDVARRRHRKSVRIEADDSDVEILGKEGDEDVEMEEVDDSEGAVGNSSRGGAEPLRLSQVLKSSQSLGGDASQQSIILDKGKGKAKQDDEIEEYESDEDEDKDEAAKDSDSSPIESASGPEDQQPNASGETLKSQSTGSNQVKHQAKKAEKEDGPAAGETEAAAAPPKKRGRPPLSQAVKDERAAEKARIQAEKEAKRAEKAAEKVAEKAAVAPKKKGRASLTKAAENEQSVSEAKETKAKKQRASTSNGNTSIMSVELPLAKSQSSSQAKSDAADTTTDVTPKKRGRPPLSQAVVEERKAEKERIKAEKAIKKLEARTTKANAKRAKGKGQATAGPLFMPSSGLVKTNSSHPGQLPSSPLIPVAAFMSQPTPSAHRRSMASADLPRFTDFQKDQALQRQKRRASHMPTSQPLATETQDSRPNGSQEILEIDESSSDENSSADEGANKTVTPSNKKRRSVLGYFSQA
ncbi:hypothetical protein FS749_005664 [Ceratobasidium sp. UAMH 11750]|nr:hypothetical protein FS749_005664 [Ceratobasidium sp. UAMH 11750]